MNLDLNTKYKEDGHGVVKVSSSDLSKNLKDIMTLLREGKYIELTKHGVKIAMIVPY